MMIEAVLAGLLLGLILKGRLSRLSTLRIRGTPLLLAAVVMQYGGQWLFDRGQVWVGAWGAPIYGCSLLLVLAFVWLNRSLPALWLSGLGVALNALVIAVNGVRMPVAAAALQAAALPHYVDYLQQGRVITHTLIDKATLLPWLGDWIPLPPPYPRPKVLSPGDVVMAAGLFYFVLVALGPPLLRRAGKRTALDTPPSTGTF